MQFNILDMFKDAVGDQIIDQASGFLGESKEGTTKAIGGLLPGLLGGLVNKGSSESGAQSILDFLGKNDMGGGLLDNLGGLFSGGEATTNLMNSGGGILDFIFGGGSSATGKIIDTVTSLAGLKRGSTSSLLRMAAPLLMGVIGKHVKSKALGALGLKNLLGSQVPMLQKLAPAGLFNSMGIGSALSGIASGLGNMGDKVVSTAGNVVETGAETVKKAGAMAGAAAAGATAAGAKAAKAGANTVSAAASAENLVLVNYYLGCCW